MNTPKTPLISIITVSYNAVATIEQTILSVINQGFEDYEYIIVDGGSTDGTVDVIDKYQDKITLWVSEPDKGIYDAMNKGVKFAKGDWLNFMNAGDEFKIINFNLFHEAFNDKKHGVVYGDVIIKKESVFDLVKAAPLNQLNYSLNFCHQSSFVRTELLRKNPFSLNYKISSDYEFFLKMFVAGHNFCYVECSVSVFEYGGLSSGVSKKYVKERVSIIFKTHIGLKNKFWFMFKFLKMLLPFNRNSIINLYRK